MRVTASDPFLHLNREPPTVVTNFTGRMRKSDKDKRNQRLLGLSLVYCRKVSTAPRSSNRCPVHHQRLHLFSSLLSPNKIQLSFS